MAASEQMVKIKDKIGSVLAKYPATRESDKLLWLGYMATFHGLPTKINSGFAGRTSYDIFKDLLLDPETPTFESLTRVRRKFQANGEYLGTNQEEKQREAESVKELMR